HMAWWTAQMVAGVLARNLIRGRTNFIRSIMNYSKVYNVEKMLADHAQPVHYELPLPPRSATDGRDAKSSQLYIHAPRGRAGRSIDDSTERFVDAARMRASTSPKTRRYCGSSRMAKLILPRRTWRECALTCPNDCRRNTVFHR